MGGTLLARWLVGSHAYGVANEFSDHDYVEVHAESPEFVTGTRVYNTQSDTAKGGGHDDTTIYGLRKWAALVQAGNPNMVETLFIEPTYLHPLFSPVLFNGDAFLSKAAPRKFLGYGQSQLDALKGFSRKKTNREELVHHHGYDTKWAYHALRIFIEGIDLGYSGVLSFPLAEAPTLVSVRNGEVSQADVVFAAELLISELRSVSNTTRLPEHPNTELIDSLLHRAYLGVWDMNKEDEHEV